MNKKTIIFSSRGMARKIKVLGKERKNIRHKFTAVENEFNLETKKLAVTSGRKENVGRELTTTAKNFRNLTKERKGVRHKLTVAEEKLSLEAEQLVKVIKEKESIGRKLAVIAKKLRSSELHFKTLFENSKDALMLLEPPLWKFTHGNQATLKMFAAKDEKEFCSVGPWKLSPERQPDGCLSSDKAKEMIKIAVHNGSNFFEWTHKRLNGEDFPANVLLTSVKLSKEKVFLQATVRDITKEKEIDKAKDELISFASHQLRTPITAILWNSEILLGGGKGALNKEQKRALEEIYISSKNMAELVGGFLDIAKMESSDFIIKAGDVDLLQISDLVLEELVSQISTKKINIVKKYGNDVPHLNIGTKTARIILQNLLNNAVKYTPDNGTVEVKIEKTTEGISISVKDNGYGIPKEAENKIFTKLFRADNARQKEPSGTGLGLYLLKLLVDKLGGKVWFESKEGTGTTFYVNLK